MGMVSNPFSAGETVTVYRASVYNPLSLWAWQFYENGALVVNAPGQIVWVGNWEECSNYLLAEPSVTYHVQDYRDCLLLPGLIDCHVHLPQLPIRGLSGKTLLDWLSRYAFPAEEAFADFAYAQRLSQQFFHMLAAAGTTTALVYSSVHRASTDIAFEAAQMSNLRIFMGKVMMDQRVPQSMLETTSQSIQESWDLAQRWHGQNEGLLGYAFTPRFALSCSTDLLKEAGQCHRSLPGSLLQTHIAENTDEILATEALAQSVYNETMSYTDLYHRTGCLGDHTVLAHGIHMGPNELTALHDTKSAMAHCPSSNFFLKSGFFPWQRYLDANIRVGLGSDVGGGPHLCMMRVMHAMDAMQLAHHEFVSPTQAVFYATLGGAQAMSLEHHTGNFMPGKSADFVVMDTTALTRALPSTAFLDEMRTAESMDEQVHRLLSSLVFLGDERYVLRTVVRGKTVYENPHPLTRELIMAP